jgi:hypothetical protein
MTPAQVLRLEASKMQHAITRDRVVDFNGKIESEREFHYLSCVRCQYEKRASMYEMLATNAAQQP